MRKLVSSPEDIWLFGGDLSNLEGRILAYYLQSVGEPRLAETFRSGVDFHTANAEAWGLVEFVLSLAPTLTVEVATKTARSIAKTALYAVLYGAGAAKIAVGASRGSPVQLSKDQGQLILDTMEEAMPAISELKQLVWSTARKRGGVLYTVTGRRLYYPGLMSRDNEVRARAERQSFNALLQGSGGDITQILQMESTPLIREYQARWAAQVHDEVLGYMRATYPVEEMTDRLTKFWSSSDLLGEVPIVAEFKYGKSWYDIK